MQSLLALLGCPTPVPKLQPASWSLAKRMLCRRLPPFGDRDAAPWVAFGKPDLERGFQFQVAPKAKAARERGIDDALAAAGQLLRELPREWLDPSTFAFAGLADTLIVHDLIASELLLVPDVLAEAHERLATDRVFVAAPRSGLLAVTAADDAKLARFAALARGEQASGPLALSTAVFEVQRGVLTNMYEPAG